MCNPADDSTAATEGPGDAPPIDENLLEGPPLTTQRDFRRARLRQFPNGGSKIEWLEYLGHGEEGIVYKATIGSSDPFAVKVVRSSRFGFILLGGRH